MQEFESLGEAPVYPAGDANHDGTVSISDAVQLCRNVSEGESLTASDAKNLDMNADALINVPDVVYILKTLHA